MTEKQLKAKAKMLLFTNFIEDQLKNTRKELHEFCKSNHIPAKIKSKISQGYIKDTDSEEFGRTFEVQYRLTLEDIKALED